MEKLFIAVSAILFASFAAAQGDGRANPLDPGAKSPAVQYRSAFEGYKPFAERDLSDWRKANDEVGAAAQKTSKPAPGKPESAGGPSEKRGGHHGHGAHK